MKKLMTGLATATKFLDAALARTDLTDAERARVERVKAEAMSVAKK